MGQIEANYWGMKIWIYSNNKGVHLIVYASDSWLNESFKVLSERETLLCIHGDLAKIQIVWQSTPCLLKRKSGLWTSCFFQTENWTAKSKQMFSEKQGEMTSWCKSWNSDPHLDLQLARAFRSVIFVMEVLTYTRTLSTCTLKYWYICDKGLMYHLLTELKYFIWFGIPDSKKLRHEVLYIIHFLIIINLHFTVSYFLSFRLGLVTGHIVNKKSQSIIPHYWICWTFQCKPSNSISKRKDFLPFS